MAIKTSISFGLVFIPVTVQPATRDNDIKFNQLHKKHKSRIRQKKIIETTGEEVEANEIVKAYQYADDKYVTFSDEDFQKLLTQKDKTITIQQFVDISEIDPIYYEKAYYLIPQAGADVAYKLLVQAMEKSGRVGIAKAVLNTKDTLIAIRAKNGTILMNTMFFYDEIQRDPVKLDAREITQQELNMAQMIIDGMTQPFEPHQYHDEYRARIEDAIKQKINGKEIIAVQEQSQNQTVDLMEALQKSLKQIPANSGKPPVLPIKTPPNFSGLQQ